MRTLFILSILLSFITSFSQITITASSMPQANDTFRLTTTATGQTINFSLTDTNYYWDFSSLNANDQRLEDFVPISNTPTIYNLIFMYPAVATLASKRPDAQLATVSITDGYNFYKVTNTKYAEVGFGANFQGAPIPVKYQSEDVIYTLPITYGSKDSCTSKWNVSIPSLGAIFETKHRVNEVDGWGIVKTPYGSFQCLRIKSTVNQKDSIKYDASPIPLPPFYQDYTEYIWYSNTLRYPVLKATLRNMAYTVEFVDSIKSFMGIGIPEAIPDFTIFPNPTSSFFSFISAPENTTVHYRLMDENGKVLMKGEATINDRIDLNGLKTGVYIVEITSHGYTIFRKIIKQ